MGTGGESGPRNTLQVVEFATFDVAVTESPFKPNLGPFIVKESVM